jgi:soluble lytic murein transglycosylase-like protein
MLYSKPEMMALVLDQSNKAEIDPALACALVHVVSAWYPASINFAPSDLIPGFDLSAEEANGQQSTYGLFQFTGSQARDRGCKDKFESLLEPQTNIEMGVGILRDCLRVTPKLETGLIVYLGRGRSLMATTVLSWVEPYRELIAQRPS